MASNRNAIILLAEDNPNDVELLRRAFALEGIDVPLHVVPNGEEAIAYLQGEGRYTRRDEFPVPDLLILDLKMPLANGFEVIEWVRSQPRLASLRIIVLTTSDQLRDIDRAHRTGANSFLVKPIHFDEFRNTVRLINDYWLKLSKTPHAARPARKIQE